MKSNSFINRLWSFFVSVRLTIVVLLSLAATSVIGTLIPQNEDPAAYLHKYGKSLYYIFKVLDVFDMYHSWWFQFLIVLLTINIIVCSINRLGSVWKIVFVNLPKFNILNFQKSPAKKEFSVKGSPDKLAKVYKKALSKDFGYIRVDNTDNGVCIFAEKWRWTRLGVYFVHLSVVLLLTGALIGSIFGFEGRVNILEGETTNSIRLFKTGKEKELDIKIRCDDFNVSFYDSGEPKEYRSSLTIFKDGKPVIKKDILVNDPLRYEGINIYQSSYGTLLPKNFTLYFTSKKTGIIYAKKASIGKEIKIPKQIGTFVIKNYVNSYNFMGHNIGEAITGILTRKSREKVNVVIPLRFPNFDKMRNGEIVISVAKHQNSYYTGLRVTHDPGVWIVYSGFIIMILGSFVTFFMSHQRVCIEIKKDKEKISVMVAGTANKNKIGMQNKISKLAKHLYERAL